MDEYEWEYLEHEHFSTVFNKIAGANGYIQYMHELMEKIRLPLKTCNLEGVRGGFCECLFVGHSFPDTLLLCKVAVPHNATAISFTKRESFVVDVIFLHTSSLIQILSPMWIFKTENEWVFTLGTS